MEKNKKTKTLAIIALIISILGLTLGFAAFSNTLTISSSATVSPDESDFNINVYGYTSDSGDIYSLESYGSSTLSKPMLHVGTESATDAKISDNGKSIIISDLSVQIKAPGEGAEYNFLIKNEGEYDAYLNMKNLESVFSGGGVSHTCIAGSDTTVNLVNEACKDVNLYGEMVDSDWYELSNDVSAPYKLAKGSYLVLSLYIDYGYHNSDSVNNVVRADGDFSVDFDDIVLEFSSVPTAE